VSRSLWPGAGQTSDTRRPHFAPPCRRPSSSSTLTGPPPSCCSVTPTGWTNSFNKRLADIYERFIADIETLIFAAQQRGDVVIMPSRLVACTLTVLIGEIAHRRLTTDDGITAAEAADFVVSFVMKGLRPDNISGAVTEQ
jgi:hypothetical protein